MKTSDLERELGLSKHTIRYYEKEGFIDPQRDDNGYRDYSDEDLQTLRLVKFLRNLNVSVDDVKAVINGQLNFHECLEVNKVHLEKQMESMKGIKQTIENYQDKQLPLIPAFENIETDEKHWKWGIHKTTKTVSLGRKLTRAWAKKQLFFSLWSAIVLAAMLTIWFFMIVDIDSMILKILFFLGLAAVIEIIIIGFSFKQISVAMLDEGLNQSVEFFEDGIRYYQYKGFMRNIRYFFSVLFAHEDAMMKTYRYEDISKVTILAKKRYMNLGSPIAYENYVADFQFDFRDGKSFYFYYPMTLDDDAKYIAIILKNKVINIQDEQDVLYAMENGINLTDYMQSKQI